MISRGASASSSSGDARTIAIDAAIVAVVKVAASITVLAGGFRAVSDDDFARVVIAEEWALSPKLDPSGTSWLPLPFWIVGLAMRVFGRGLDVARGIAITLGIASAILVYIAARWITEDRRAALVGSIIAAVFPWSARLGVAMVPELPAAALTLLAVASLAPQQTAPYLSPGRALVGGAAIAASALSRYEAWPIAAIFAAIVAYHAIRDARPPGSRAKLLLAIALALAAPAAWILWNRAAHGDALHFLERVAAYRRALGGGADGGALRAVFAYPIALARHEPELVGSFFLMAAFALMSAARLPSSLADRPRRYALPAVILLTQIALLAAAMVKDGAPTHHPERALLSAMLLLAIAAGDLGVTLFSSGALRSLRRPALAIALAAWILPTALVFRRWIRIEDFAERSDEAAIGLAAAALVPPGDRVLVEAADYGYFAVIAALARPEDVVIDRSIDPRGGLVPSSFGDRDALLTRLDQSGARYFIARLSSPAVPARAEEVRGAWGLFKASTAGLAPSPSSLSSGALQ